MLPSLFLKDALKGSWDLVTGVIIEVATLITPLRVLITLLTKSHDPPSNVGSPAGCRFSMVWKGPA